VTEKSLPRYWASEMPADLTTENGLARLRRRLVPGQKPVALLVYGKREETSPAYRIGDAVPLPPLTPAQRKAARRRRTVDTCCRVCGRDAGHPLGGGNHTPGICDDCRDDHAWQHILENRPRHRQAASEWAAGVAADPKAVLIAVDIVDVRQPAELSIVKRHAVARVGFVPVAGGEPTWYNLLPQEKPKRLMDLPPGVLPGTGLTAPAGKEGERYRGVPIGEVAMTISDALYGKRPIGWGEWGVNALMSDLRYAVRGYGYRPATDPDGWGHMGPRQLRVEIGDQLGKRYSEWAGMLHRGGSPYLTINGSARGYVAQQCPNLPPADRVMWMLEQLGRMATSPTRGNYP
jgi:hypothetical protein